MLEQRLEVVVEEAVQSMIMDCLYSLAELLQSKAMIASLVQVVLVLHSMSSVMWVEILDWRPRGPENFGSDLPVLEIEKRLDL
jgi:hypothetical protein